MGFHRGLLGFWAIVIIFLLLLISSLLSPAVSHQIQANAKDPSHVPRKFQVYNTRPFFVSEDLNGNRSRKRKTKRKTIKNFDSRPFSAMLPKGYVPPSGSSPCHNDLPDSIDFYCDDSTTYP